MALRVKQRFQYAASVAKEAGRFIDYSIARGPKMIAAPHKGLKFVYNNTSMTGKVLFLAGQIAGKGQVAAWSMGAEDASDALLAVNLMSYAAAVVDCLIYRARRTRAVPADSEVDAVAPVV